tara:strand:- start:828 stop:1103 length:276 start_codon:yes stop_codon:yes gene_type:complete
MTQMYQDELGKEGREKLKKVDQIAARYEAIFQKISKSGISGDEICLTDDVWHLAFEHGKISDVDIGFIVALEGLATKISRLEDRINHLESK